MTEAVIDLKQALHMARTFNLAFNNAFMYGGSHQTTKDSATAFFNELQPLLEIISILTISTEKDSIYIENHCVDKLVSVQRINSRFKKAGIQSINFDRDAALEGALAIFFLLGALAEYNNVESMQEHLRKERIPGVKINYVVYRKVTIDDEVVNKDVLAENQLQLRNSRSDTPINADSGTLLQELSGILSLHSSAGMLGNGSEASPDSPKLSQVEYDRFITNQIKSLNNQLVSTSAPIEDTTLSPSEMLEAIYKVKENVLENIKLQKETGKLLAADELVINEINQISYQVIVRLIKEEYRNDRKISVKRLAQIIRRMLPDITELKYLLPQLKDGLFAEGMSPSDYLALVKELSNELDSDGLLQLMAEASDQVGLTLNELIDGIREAPEETARLIVLAAEIKKGGVRADDQQMSAVLSDYIEKVSRVLALQSPETATPGGGSMLKSAVTRIERELLDRLKSQNVDTNTISEVAKKLASQFNDTLANVKGDWIRKNLSNSEKPSEEVLLSIIDQVAEHGQEDVTDEIKTILLSRGLSETNIDAIVTKARQRALAAIKHSVEIPPGAFNASNTIFFLDREINLNLRYNTPFSTLLISCEKMIDTRTAMQMEITPDIQIQLTNQFLKLLKELQKRDLDIIGICKINNMHMPLIILSMTEINGALYVKKRINKEFRKHEFMIDGIPVSAELKITVTGNNKKATPDKLSYMKNLYQLHNQPTLQ